MKKSITEVNDLAGKRVLVRADLDVPIKHGVIINDVKIRAAIPTLLFLRNQQARIIVCAHLGSPEGKFKNELRLDPIGKRLAELLGCEVKRTKDCVGLQVHLTIKHLKPAQVLLLENTRFHIEEQENDARFAQQLAELADLYVNDAFACSHKAHASTEGITHYLQSFAGILMEKELKYCAKLMEHPEHPFVIVMGGARISEKISAIRNLLPHVDSLCLGGEIASTILRATKVKIGKSIIQEDALDEAQQLFTRAGSKLVLPADVVAAREISGQFVKMTFPIHDIPPEFSIVDIGPQTCSAFIKTIQNAKTVLWYGPLGMVEIPNFSQGTMSILNALADLNATVIAGGENTTSIVHHTGMSEKITHVSTGGDAFLSFLEGKRLPGIAALQDREEKLIPIDTNPPNSI